MPSDPENKKIEELLKAYARKRQDEAGAPLELHPATRTLLKDEVARQRARPARRRESWLGRMLLFWPRLAMAASLLVALGIAAWVLSPPPVRDDTLLAKRNDAPPAPDSPVFEATPPPARFTPARVPARELQVVLATGGPAGEKNVVVKEEDRDASTEPPSLGFAEQPGQRRFRLAASEPSANQVMLKSPSAGAGANAPVLNYSLGVSAATNGVIREGFLASDRLTPGNAPPPLPSLALADTAKAQPPARVELLTAASKDFPGTKEALSTSEKNKIHDDLVRLSAAKTGEAYYRQRGGPAGESSNAGSLRLRFVQPAVFPATQEPTAPATNPAVLSQFEMKQDGARVQLVDFDGSVYDGWVVANGDAKDASLGTEARVPLPAARKEETRKESAEFEALQVEGAGQRNVAFRVSGISRHLGQPIVVEGTMLVFGDNPAVADAPAPTTAPVRGPGRAAVQPRAARPLRVSPGGRDQGAATNASRIQRVVGKVRIGTTNEVRLDAVPAKN